MNFVKVNVFNWFGVAVKQTQSTCLILKMTVLQNASIVKLSIDPYHMSLRLVCQKSCRNKIFIKIVFLSNYTVSILISMLRVDNNVWFSRRSFARRNIIYYYRFKWPLSVLAIFSPIFPGRDKKWYFCFWYRVFLLKSSPRYR